MLQQILYILISSCICCAWGLPPLLLLGKNAPADHRWYRSWLSFIAFLSLLGCITLSTISSWCYLFIPMKFGYLLCITVIQLPVTLLLGRKKLLTHLPGKKNIPAPLRGPALFFLTLGACLLLLLSCLPVSSGDTQIYHLQLISWATQFPVVPGLANLFPRFGLGSNWFDLIALFHIPAWTAGSFSYLNATLAIWFFIWLFCRWHYHWAKAASSAGSRALCLFYFLVIAYCLLDWELLRGTANSTDYDTIVTVCVFLPIDFWLEGLLEPQEQPGFSYLFVMITSAAIGFKLSGMVVTILLLYYLLRSLSPRHILFTALTGLLVLSPILLKNYITTGYPLFPLSLRTGTPDWQMPNGMVNKLRNYITLSNRFYNQDFDNSDDFMRAHANWAPGWFISILWQQKAVAVLTICSASLFFFRPGRFINIFRLRILLLLLLLMALTWFLTAPSPRFGYGILLFTAFLPPALFLGPAIPRSWYKYGLLLGSAFVLAYLPAKIRAFAQTTSGWLRPPSVPMPAYRTVTIHGADYHLPVKVTFGDRMCGFLDLPCIGTENPYLARRDTSLREGFRFYTFPDSTFIRNYNY